LSEPAVAALYEAREEAAEGLLSPRIVKAGVKERNGGIDALRAASIRRFLSALPSPGTASQPRHWSNAWSPVRLRAGSVM
jgi:hypothetical protein